MVWAPLKMLSLVWAAHAEMQHCLCAPRIVAIIALLQLKCAEVEWDEGSKEWSLVFASASRTPALQT